MNYEQLPILIILVLSVLGHNNSVAIAASLLLFLKLAGFAAYLPLIEEKGISIGVIVLTLSVLTPLVTGKISILDMAESFKTVSGLAGIIAGIFVAWAAGKGLSLISDSPQVVSPLVIGTLIGVCFFHGIAVGPLIAGGLVWIIMLILRGIS